MQRAHIINWIEVEYSEEDPLWNPDDDYYDYRILAEGDSWFSIAGMPGSNLLFPMCFDAPAVIVNCASSGDCKRLSTKDPGNIDFYHAMSASHGSNWDAILISCGGMDLIEHAGQIIRMPAAASTDPAAYCDEARLDEILRGVISSYRHVIELRDQSGSSCAGKPVIAHTYDWITPRNASSRFIGLPLSGPYLYTALSNAGIDQVHWNDISDYLIGRLRDTLLSLAQGGDALPNFHVVTTQGSLNRAAPGMNRDSNDWSNEDHPNTEGYTKISAIIETRLQGFLS